MALYQQNIFKPAPLRMTFGAPPLYLFGSLDKATTPWRFAITNSALTSDVVTLNVAFTGGGGSLPLSQWPTVGAIAGVLGSTNDSGAVNTNYVVLTGVSLNSAGVGTVTYALSHGDIASAVDSGELRVLPQETADIVAAGTASAPIALTFSPDDSDNSRCLFAEAVWSGTKPSAATVVLEAANVDDDSRYMVLSNAQGCSPTGVVASSDALATIAGSAVTQSGAQYSFILGKFLRAKVLSMSGGDGTTGLIVTLF